MFVSNTRETVKTYTKQYSGFKGVDFSSAITEVDDRRSPDAVNMIADFGGFPCKRTGYAILDSGFDGRINGIFKFIDAQSVKRMVIHAGTKIYSYIETAPILQPNPPTSYVYIAVMPENATPTVVFTGAQNTRSSAFTMGNKLYILDGANYIVYDGEQATRVDGHIPTTVITATPQGGGEDYEPINLISPYRINEFSGTQEATEYQLDATNLASVDKIEILSASGEWQTTTAYTVNLETGVVTFSTAPGVSPVEGADNVRIKFSKPIIENENKIRQCTIFTFFGNGNDNRIFLSGNANFRNYDWCSATNDPTYFPDTGYTVIGADNSAIMGYHKQYSDLVIIKQSNDQDATMYLRRCSEDNTGKTIFPVTQGLAGVGAVSRYCFGTLFDDNLFLSSDGVFGLDTSKVTLQKTAQNRSLYINAKLTRESDLENAVSCIWNGYYCLFINNRVYLADAKQQNANQSGSFGYEWYYWENIPASVACEYEGKLYFGTSDGKVCVMKTEDEYLMDAYTDDGEAIDAYWTTKLDDLGDPSTTKTIKKRNIGVVAMPFAKSSAQIYYLKNGEENFIKEYALSSEFDFDNFDFDNINFGLASSPYFVPTNKKSKNNKMFRIKIRNNKASEAFGLYKIVFNYEYAKAIKR